MIQLINLKSYMFEKRETLFDNYQSKEGLEKKYLNRFHACKCGADQVFKANLYQQVDEGPRPHDPMTSG